MYFGSTFTRAEEALSASGSKDGHGAGDRDEPYVFGRRPRALACFPFTAVQFSHLLRLRGRVQDGLYGADDLYAIATPGHADTPAGGHSISANSMHPWSRCATCGAMTRLAKPLGHPSSCDRCQSARDRDAVAYALLRPALDGLAGQ